jgi:hypothetical protein
MTWRPKALSEARLEALRDALLSTVELLKRRKAADVPQDYIDDYVELNWLEWHGGSLRLTITGDNVCRQLSLAQRVIED